MRLSWKNKRVDSLFDREDVLGNKIMNVSRIGIHANLRYTVHNNFVFISVKDIIAMFGPPAVDVDDVWNNHIKDDIKTQLYLYEHQFHRDDTTLPSTELDRYCVTYFDGAKLIARLPIDTMAMCKFMEIFLLHYQTRFLKAFNMSSGSLTLLYFSNCFANTLHAGFYIVGFLTSTLLFWGLGMLRA